MKHLLISYHTCPTEQPGQHLAGGMNVLLTGYLQNTQVTTHVVTRSFTEYQRLQFTPSVTIHRLPCQARQPWTREGAWNCLPAFQEALKQWKEGQSFDVASAHYWMSAWLLPQLALPGGIMFHTLQAQKGPPRNPLEQIRLKSESQLIGDYPTAFLHWHDLNNARGHYPTLRGTVLRPGVSLAEDQGGAGRLPLGPPYIYGWAARNDPIKNLDIALEWLERQPPGTRLRVAGLKGPSSPGNVEYLGPLEHRDMGKFYRSIHQLLNLSAYETYGLSILEALACGAAVGVRPDSDWARRLRRLHLPWEPGNLFSDSQRQTARRLAEAHSWTRVLSRWDRWLTNLQRSVRLQSPHS